MSSILGRHCANLAAGLLLGALAACAPAAAPTPSRLTGTANTPTSTPVASTIAASATPAAFASATPQAVLSATADAPVSVTALGNVNIRRGPDLAFNPIAVLARGAVVTATGRDVLSDWLRIPLPNDKSSVGWISIMSEFTRVQGELDALPEIEPQEWPALASLRNCTFHELWIEPAGVTLPPQYEFPNNDLRLNPGTYSILDVDVDGYPEILKAELREGMTIEVLVDGLGEKKKCPPP